MTLRITHLVLGADTKTWILFWSFLLVSSSSSAAIFVLISSYVFDILLLDIAVLTCIFVRILFCAVFLSKLEKM